MDNSSTGLHTFAKASVETGSAVGLAELVDQKCLFMTFDRHTKLLYWSFTWVNYDDIAQREMDSRKKIIPDFFLIIVSLYLNRYCKVLFSGLHMDTCHIDFPILQLCHMFALKKASLCYSFKAC